MERIELENKIKDFIIKSKNQKLWILFEKSMKNFDNYDLEKIINFLENWDKNMLLEFIKEKTKNMMWEAQAIKFAKWKIIIWKNTRIEKKEKIEEEKELENLLNQL